MRAIKQWRTGICLGLLAACVAPAAAQQTIVIGGSGLPGIEVNLDVLHGEPAAPIVQQLQPLKRPAVQRGTEKPRPAQPSGPPAIARQAPAEALRQVATAPAPPPVSPPPVPPRPSVLPPPPVADPAPVARAGAATVLTPPPGPPAPRQAAVPPPPQATPAVNLPAIPQRPVAGAGAPALAPPPSPPPTTSAAAPPPAPAIPAPPATPARQVAAAPPAALSPLPPLPPLPAAPPVAAARAAAAPPTATQETIQGRFASLPPEGGEVLRLEFRDGSTTLANDGEQQLRALANTVRSSESRLQVKAYAAGDSDNSSRARRLALSRALIVRSFLIEQGIRSTRVDVRALGVPSDGGPEDRVDLLLLPR